jgi:hypothetical protein
VEQEVLGLVDLAHPAGGEEPHDPVALGDHLRVGEDRRLRRVVGARVGRAGDGSRERHRRVSRATRRV